MLLSKLFRTRTAAARLPEARPALIENLERRTLLSAGPHLTGIRILGPVARAYGIVLSFDSPLDVASAQDTSNYVFGHPVQSSSDNGVDIGTILGFLAARRQPAIKNGKIQFLGARYDDASQTVTLTPVKPFNVWRFFRVLRINGAGNDPVSDPSGNPLNGGQGTVLHWTHLRGKTIRYSDADGDHVVIRLKGAGKLYAFLHKSGDPFPTIFVMKTNARSSLTGTVDQSQTGNGIAHIAQLSGAIPAKTNMFSDTQIDVQST